MIHCSHCQRSFADAEARSFRAGRRGLTDNVRRKLHEFCELLRLKSPCGLPYPRGSLTIESNALLPTDVGSVKDATQATRSPQGTHWVNGLGHMSGVDADKRSYGHRVVQGLVDGPMVRAGRDTTSAWPRTKPRPFRAGLVYAIERVKQAASALEEHDRREAAR